MAEIIEPTREQIERYYKTGIMMLPLRSLNPTDLEESFVDLGMVESCALEELNIQSAAEQRDLRMFATPAYAWTRGNVDLYGCEHARIYVASLRLAEENISIRRGILELPLTKRLDGFNIEIVDGNPKNNRFEWDIRPVYS